MVAHGGDEGRKVLNKGAVEDLPVDCQGQRLYLVPLSRQQVQRLCGPEGRAILRINCLQGNKVGVDSGGAFRQCSLVDVEAARCVQAQEPVVNSVAHKIVGRAQVRCALELFLGEIKIRTYARHKDK